MTRPPTWFEWLTVAAIVLGPVLALFAQRTLDWLRERRSQRVQLFRTLMSTRASILAPAHVQALNSIDVVFSRRRDSAIRDAWRALLDHMVTPMTNPGWAERTMDLRVVLYQAMGATVGYNYTVDYLKRRIYAPIAHAQTEQDWLRIRQTFLKVLTEEGIKIIPGGPPPPTAPPGPPTAPHR
jgi:hypothetical protein